MPISSRANPPIPCGSGLARDAITAVGLTGRGARIASKPAPTKTTTSRCDMNSPSSSVVD
ncbi:MAG TPA: hypothetical protein DD669_22770 [Pseudomonas sp.]|nr:hypothetical protein [Pseudomonas sp.]